MRTAAIFALVGTISALASTPCKEIETSCSYAFTYDCTQTTTRAEMQVIQTETNHKLLTASAALAAENKTVATLTK